MKVLFLLVVAMSLSRAHAAAQANVVPIDREALVFSASVAGGYDDDVTSGTAAPSGNPLFRTGGSFVMSDLGMSYAVQGRRVSLSAGAGSSIRFYRAVETFTADTYGGSIGVSAAVTRRLRVAANAAASRSSHYTLSLLPAFSENALEQTVVPSLDYSLTAADLTRYHSGAQISYNLTKRSTASVYYSLTESTADNLFGVKSASWGGRFTQGLTRYATLRLGYGKQEASYTSPVRQISAVDTYDIGVDYARPLSFSRRTTVRVSAGTAFFEARNRTHGTVIGQAALRHRVSRDWNLTATFIRGVGFIEGFAEPMLTDSVVSHLEGTIHPRVTVRGTLGYGNGGSDIQMPDGPRYRTYTTGVRTMFALYRGLFAFSEYVFYHYEFEQLSPLHRGAPRQLNRQGIRSGLIYNVPIL